MIRLLHSTWVRAVLSAAILWWLSGRIDMAEAIRAVFTVRLPHLLFVLALVGIDRVIMIYRWVLLLRASGVAISTDKAADIFLVSSFVGSFLPAGVGADMARAYSLRNHILPLGPGDGPPGASGILIFLVFKKEFRNATLSSPRLAQHLATHAPHRHHCPGHVNHIGIDDVV